MQKLAVRFVYLINPRLYNVDKDTLFFVQPLKGILKDSDITYDPQRHTIVNYDDYERLRDTNDGTTFFLKV